MSDDGSDDGISDDAGGRNDGGGTGGGGSMPLAGKTGFFRGDAIGSAAVPPVAALQGGVEVEVEVLITQARRLFAQQASRSAVPIWGVPPTWLLLVDLCSRWSQAG